MLIGAIFALGTHAAYRFTKAAAARCPEMVDSQPMTTRSGCNRSRTAVPSDRNSGLDSIGKTTPGRYASIYNFISDRAYNSTPRLTYDIFDHLASFARYCALLHQDGTSLSMKCNISARALKSSHVGSTAGAHTTLLRRCIDTDQTHVRLRDSFNASCCEEKIGHASSLVQLLYHSGSATHRANLCSEPTSSVRT